MVSNLLTLGISSGVVSSTLALSFLIGNKSRVGCRRLYDQASMDNFVPSALKYLKEDSKICMIESKKEAIPSQLLEHKGLDLILIASFSQNVGDERARELMRKYKDYHFTLFDNPKQMWIEGCHPQEEELAIDCEYMPPYRAVCDSRYYRLKTNFLHIKQFLKD